MFGFIYAGKHSVTGTYPSGEVRDFDAFALKKFEMIGTLSMGLEYRLSGKSGISTEFRFK